MRGSRAKAEERFRRVLERFPQSKNSLLFLAEVLIAQGRTTEARGLLETSQATCQRLLRTNRDQLDAMAARLLECEVLSGGELKLLLGSGLPCPASRG